MKKKFLTFILTITAMLTCIFGLTACNKVEFKVNFIVDGEIYSTLNTNGEEIIKMPENPTKEGYTFDGWFWDKDTWQTPFTANSLLDAPLSSDMSVYCKWKLNTISVESVSLNKTEITLHENDVEYLTTTILPTNATNTEVTWESSNPTIATVIGGKVTALRVGNATITATTVDGGKIATCNVYVSPVLVESVSLNHTTLTLLNGETKTLTATIYPNNATEKGVIWQSSNSSIVTVENGVIKAVGYGTAAITAISVDGEKTATCTISIVQDKIEFKTLTVDGETVYGKVNNDTATFSFIKEIVEYGNATYKVFKEITCETEIYSKSISLNVGDNTVYILQTVGRDIKLYTVTVRRRPTYEVTFNSNGGSIVESQTVEEDSLATEPTIIPTRAGYAFDGWNYDFTTPITGYTTIDAKWTANTDTQYKVEYYLQNLNGYGYTIDNSLTENLTGTTDTTANAEIKDIEHFTAESQTVSGNINGNGSTVLKVYYTRDSYTVTFDGNGGTLSSGKSSQTVKYGGSVTAPTFTKTGYTFTGYDKTNYDNISESFTATATWQINQYTVTIKYGNDLEDKVITQDYNSEITEVLPNEVERAGYTFNGWDKVIPANMPAKNTTITAKWLAIFNHYNGAINGLTSHGKTLSEIVIPENIDGVKITIISEDAFSGCRSLTSITLPFIGASRDGTSNTYFGYIFGASSYSENSSYVPSSLKKVIITGGESISNYAFYNCTSLETVTIEEGSVLTSIGDYAFCGCTSLESIEIPNNVTSIGNDAFDDCNSLTYNVKENLKYLGNSENPYLYLADTTSTNITTANIDSNCRFIGYCAFYNCTSLKIIEIPNSVTSIGEDAFYYCTSLKIIEIPNSVTSIGEGAFYYCTSLKIIEIPNSVTSIGNYAFYNCYSLTSVTFGENSQLTSIDDYAFYNCYSLTSVTFGENSQLTSIGEYAFAYCSSLTSVTFGENSQLTSIGEDAFYYCTSLESIEIPNSVTSIGNYAFYNCYSLTSVTFGENSQLTSIGYGAFYCCRSLTSIEIPNSVTSIGSYAFEYCSKLTSITFNDTSTWYRTKISDYWEDKTGGTQTSVTNASTNATYFRSTYSDYYWYKL